MEVTPEGLARFFDVVLPHMNEVQRRVVAGAAGGDVGPGRQDRGGGGVGDEPQHGDQGRGRGGGRDRAVGSFAALGGGDKPLVDKQPGLLEALDELVQSRDPGEPDVVVALDVEVVDQAGRGSGRQGFEVSARTVLRLLHRLGYSLQANAKVTEGRQHPDRDAQFRYLNDMADGFIDDGQPAISVDTKKKELIGEFANGGAEWAPAGEPERVSVHDFADRALGEFAKAIPYGIYDLSNDEGWVNVGDSGRHRRVRGQLHPGRGGTRWAGTASPTPTGC